MSGSRVAISETTVLEVLRRVAAVGDNGPDLQVGPREHRIKGRYGSRQGPHLRTDDRQNRFEAFRVRAKVTNSEPENERATDTGWCARWDAALDCRLAGALPGGFLGCSWRSSRLRLCVMWERGAVSPPRDFRSRHV